MLRPYQQKAIDDLYAWMSRHDGHPCLVLPTGSGKSHIVAHLCKDAVQNWPDTRILMLTHVKELIEQNAEKMRQVWPNAPLGIYSAGLGRRDLDVITFAGIQSVRKKARYIGHIDLVIVDECHLISHKAEGGYRTLIKQLEEINPSIRVIGLTATPYRLGHGYITDGDALFDGLIEPVQIASLVADGYLAPLRSKVTQSALDVSGVHKRGGEYIERELQAAVDTETVNRTVIRETISLAGDRKAWLFFCAGVDHAYHVRDELREHGIVAETVTGGTGLSEREAILGAYKRGEIQAITNANVLTTGFDYPDIDLIVMLRPTMSPGLYVQMAGRGMRLKSHTDHCLVLDFAGVVAQHGPITYITPPQAKESRDTPGEAPVKACDDCHELVHPSCRICPACGHEFPEPEKPKLSLRDDDIMGLSGKKMKVTEWLWADHLSRSSGKKMIKVTYYGALSDRPIIEYLPILHEGYAGQKAMASLASIARQSGITLPNGGSLVGLCKILNDGRAPGEIEYLKDGKFNRVNRRIWNATPEA